MGGDYVCKKTEKDYLKNHKMLSKDIIFEISHHCDVLTKFRLKQIDKNSYQMIKYRKIVVRSNHYWSEKKSLILIIFSDTEYMCKIIDDEGKKISIDFDQNEIDIIEMLESVFIFIGCSPETLKIEGGNLDEVYDKLYNIAFNKNIIFIGTAMCHNHWICTDMYDRTINNLGDILSMFTDDRKSPTNKLDRGWSYEYPDSVWLHIHVFDNIPKICTRKDCHVKPKKFFTKLNPNVIYIVFGYCR